MSTGYSSTGYFLLDNPPARSQYRRVRRAKPTGAIVLHTAESILDKIDPDTGAENVARFIQRRPDPGSYHRIGDRDSIIPMVPFSYEAWQDGTGSNAWAIGISLAMQAHTWPTLHKEHRNALIDTMARMAWEAATWLREQHGISVPAVRLSKANSDRGHPGFIAHGDRDPARRTDPGRYFPWNQFLKRYNQLMKGEQPMTPEQTRHVKDMQSAFNSTGLIKPALIVDGLPGPKTTAAAKTVSVAAMGTPDEDTLRLARLGQAFADAVADADVHNNLT